ncbi:MAG TPA: hypothetical protein VM553_20050 [Dongiaceae bacterium]|nr:hypothetical protein [Dongiaceae bacterium]
MSRLSRLLDVRIILIAAFLFCSPALISGYLGDDNIHHALLSPEIAIPKANDWSLFGLFSWIDADPARNRVLMDLGVIPWWTYEGMRYQFWRPLAEISHWIDHRLWHQTPLLMHLHSLLWYLGLGYLVYRLFRRLQLDSTPAALALVVFMLDSTHGLTLSWLANRNALMAAFFGVLCIYQYVQWREHRLPINFMASLICLIASLFSSEMGISTTCYLGAYALTLDKRGARKGLIALWPFALTCIVWWTLYKLGNFGANNSDINYIDPVESPLIFLSNAFERIPVLLFAQFGIVPAEIYGFSPKPVPIYLAVACLFIAGLIYLLWPILKSNPAARFWAIGAFLSVAPITTTVPADRNLIFVGIGASALLGQLFYLLFTRQLLPRLRRAGTWMLVVIHLILSPLLMPALSYSPQLWNQLMGLRLAYKMPISDNGASLLTFGIPMPIGLGATPMRFVAGMPTADKFWMISSLKQHFVVTRITQDQLRVTANEGMIDSIEETLRDLKRHPLSEHFKIALTDLEIAVTRVGNNGKPQELILTFSNDRLEKTQILCWTGKTFELRDVPQAVGDSVELILDQPPRMSSTDNP